MGIKRRFKRAGRDTGWISVKSDIIVPGVVIAATVILLRDSASFRINDLVLPALYGLAALLASHLGLLAWNFWRAGDRLTLEDEKKARICAESERDHTLEQLATIESSRVGPAGPPGAVGPAGATGPALLARRVHVSFPDGMVNIDQSDGVIGITDEGLGIYTIDWSSPFPDTNYDVIVPPTGGRGEVHEKTPDFVTIVIFNHAGEPSDIEFGVIAL